MIVSVADGARLYPLEMQNFASYLLMLPEPIDELQIERDTTPLRGVESGCCRNDG